eukprot:CAMPEP_0178983600 /NCGR_PEP_ID=MMETSP0795-20121207/1148_1 /TAXON_ID=88552 /ORGANISM="Amoebophrya sp., Strain Ameob2" /LENGTH=393 /DNA_ID=CAMNT_0020674387 /DNA_START=65 /DNA_END=1246 /DNA_ORIENTATION=-
MSKEAPLSSASTVGRPVAPSFASKTSKEQLQGVLHEETLQPAALKNLSGASKADIALCETLAKAHGDRLRQAWRYGENNRAAHRAQHLGAVFYLLFFLAVCCALLAIELKMSYLDPDHPGIVRRFRGVLQDKNAVATLLLPDVAVVVLFLLAAVNYARTLQSPARLRRDTVYCLGWKCLYIIEDERAGFHTTKIPLDDVGLVAQITDPKPLWSGITHPTAAGGCSCWGEHHQLKYLVVLTAAEREEYLEQLMSVGCCVCAWLRNCFGLCFECWAPFRARAPWRVGGKQGELIFCDEAAKLYDLVMDARPTTAADGTRIRVMKRTEPQTVLETFAAERYCEYQVEGEEKDYTRSKNYNRRLHLHVGGGEDKKTRENNDSDVDVGLLYDYGSTNI